MALYDHRSFRHDAEWWVAQVHSQSGGGWGDGPFEMTQERVYFTCLTKSEDKSRTISIPVGTLNAMNHRSVVRFLEAADPMDSRFPMSPYNTPDEAEYQNADTIVDEEGLRWAVHESNGLASNPFGAHVVVRVICFDDSALRRDVLMESATTFSNFKAARGAEGLRDLVATVKGSYEELSPRGDI